jgi:hypothetical protein
VGIEEQAGLLERLDDAAVIPVEVLDHGVVAGEVAADFALEGGGVGDVGAELEALGVVLRHELGGRHVGVVRRLDAECGEERFSIAVLLRLSAVLEVADQEIGELVRFIAGEPVVERILSCAAVDPAIPLAVVVLVTGPGLEAAAAGRVGDEEGGAAVALVPAAEMPFAEVGGMVDILVEDVGDGLLSGGKRVLVAGDAVVRVAAGK